MHDVNVVIALCALSLFLGLRHGFAPDHLTVIDGLTRRSFARHPTVARLAGILFSLGHNAVVICVAFAAVALASRWSVPAWLEVIGTAVSAVFLLGLAAVNLYAAWQTKPDKGVHLHGLRTAFFTRMPVGVHPLAIIAVGMLFAISFDTLAQATAISVAAGKFGGPISIAEAIGCFALGMLLTGGINGLWVAHLMGAADRKAAVANRIMTITVGLLSLVVGLLALTKLAALPIGDWGEANAAAIGLAVVLILIVAFAWAVRTRSNSNTTVERSHPSSLSGGS